MPTVMVAGALAIFAYVAGHSVFSKYLGMPHIPGAGELAVFCAAMAGAGLGFLWFNAYPAEVFMGDVGALALGAALGVVAVIVRQEIVLFIMGGVFVVETLSVMLQVASFKLHRQTHLPHGAAAPPLRTEGLEGNQVVVRFWIITMMLVLVGLSTLKIEMKPMTSAKLTPARKAAGASASAIPACPWCAGWRAHGATVRVADSRDKPPHAARLQAELPGSAAVHRHVQRRAVSLAPT